MYDKCGRYVVDEFLLIPDTPHYSDNAATPRIESNSFRFLMTTGNGPGPFWLIRTDCSVIKVVHCEIVNGIYETC